MARVFDVARYILEKMGPLSTMKLQKLCYYSQAWALVWDDEPLFDEEFEAWANGPVCRELFFENQGKYSVSAMDVNGDSSVLSLNQKDTVNTVLETYGDKNAQWLSTLTHMEEPWKTARGELPTGAPCDRLITKESMAIYYASL